MVERLTIQQLKDAVLAAPEKHPHRPQLAVELAASNTLKILWMTGVSLPQHSSMEEFWLPVIRNYPPISLRDMGDESPNYPSQIPAADRECVNQFIQTLQLTQKVFKEAGAKQLPFFYHLLLSIWKLRSTDFKLDTKITQEYIDEGNALPTFDLADKPVIAMMTQIEYDAELQKWLVSFERRVLLDLTSQSRKHFEQSPKDPSPLYEVIPLLEKFWKEPTPVDSDKLKVGTFLANFLLESKASATNLECCDEVASILKEVLSHDHDPWVKSMGCGLWSDWGRNMLGKQNMTGSQTIIKDTIVQLEAFSQNIEPHSRNRVGFYMTLMELHEVQYHATLEFNNLENWVKSGKEALRYSEEITNRRGMFELCSALDRMSSHTGDNRMKEDAIRYASKLLDFDLFDKNSPDQQLCALVYFDLLLISPAHMNFWSHSFRGDKFDLERAIRICYDILSADKLDPATRVRTNVLLCGLLIQEIEEVKKDGETEPRPPHRPTSHDLEQAVLLGQEAIKLCLDEGLGWHTTFLHVANSLKVIYTFTVQQEFLDAAMFLTRKVLDSSSEKLPERKMPEVKSLLFALIVIGRGGGEQLREEDIPPLMELLFDSANSGRFRDGLQTSAAMTLCMDQFRLHKDMDWERLANVTEQAVRSLHVTSSRGLGRDDQFSKLKIYSTVASQASAVALEVGKGASHALELLEFGRGILANFMLESKGDLTLLRKNNSSIAERLSTKMDELKQASSPSNPDIWKIPRLDKEVDEILGEIREIPGFNSFLLPPKADDLRQNLCNGTIVMINVSFRCDAIIIKDGTISHLKLPHLKEASIKTACRFIPMIRSRICLPRVQHSILLLILRWLWKAAVGPILSQIGYTETPKSGEKWPRVWWIATGILSRLPIHAAGLHKPGSNESALDRVVSSYSPSIKAMKYTRENIAKKKVEGGTGEIVLAYMETTPSLAPLIHAGEEVSEIRKILESSQRPIKSLKQPLKYEVIDWLNTCDIFHFAGHGESNMTDPYSSRIFLRDWNTDPFNVSTLMDMNLHERSPWLAYLSACSTGEIKDDKLRDEAIHLVSACQLAGFQHVVGSFWEVSDLESVEIAKKVYMTIKDGIGTNGDVALGLHQATRHLRGLDSTGNQNPSDDGRSEALDHEEWDELWEDDFEKVSEILSSFDEESLEGIRFAGDSRNGNLRDLRDSKNVKEVIDQETSGQIGNPFLWATYFHVGV
ncbi:CHAT domain-containing protein [Annulohypoxylon moriforme]|nr:CHAT domain-containing protein [Annulohypoxylon moriforme]